MSGTVLHLQSRVLCPSENVPGLVYSGNCWVWIFAPVFVTIPMEGVSAPLQPPSPLSKSLWSSEPALRPKGLVQVNTNLLFIT